MKLFYEALERKQYYLDLDAADIESAIAKTVHLLAADDVIPLGAADEVIAELQNREHQAPTAIGHGVAVPHAYLDAISEPLIVFVRLAHSINLGALDGFPTRFLFMLLGPQGGVSEHLDSLANIARLTSDDEFRYDAGMAETQQDLLRALERFKARTAPAEIAATRERNDGLVYTGRLGGGLVADIQRRWAHYISDFRDGMQAKTLSSTFFLLFACLAPAVTFGGIMGLSTGGNIGVVEMLVATAACGVIYSLCAGQPLIILGGVGPLLVFTTILYRLCGDMDLPFLPTYAWVGFWTALILIILAAMDASALMRFFTRFTDEIFSALMSIIFIYEAAKAMFVVLKDSFTSSTDDHDMAILSLLLSLGTFFIAINLSRFRRSKYLRAWMREFVSDFGPMIALVTMALIAWFLKNEVPTKELDVPETFQTTTGRAWLVDVWAVPMTIRLLTFVPALLAALLIFLTQNITARIVNSPDHRLTKGPAYHLDLAIVGVLIGFCSFFGLPWLVAATVRSLAHVRGLAEMEEAVVGDGETRERIIHVHENRVTGLAIHVMIGVSLLSLSLMTVVPMAVLYGIFLFMGVVSLQGNQFFERMTLWLTDPYMYPGTHYIRRVPKRFIHKFTFLQLMCLAVLCTITLSSNESLRLSFPFFIALLVPIRFAVGRMFEERHLDALDAEETPQEEETHWSA